MIKIIKATTSDAKQLSKISKKAFLVPHGKAGSKADIGKYVTQNFSEENLIREISNPNFEYFLIFYDDKLAGYSKIIFNSENENITSKNVTKMERLYLLEEFYGLNLGAALLEFNIKIAKENNQIGIWLAVWVENHRAISFYKKIGFVKVGDFDFVVSATRSNPNYILFLEF